MAPAIDKRVAGQAQSMPSLCGAFCMSTVAALSVVAKADPVARARALGPALTAAGDEIERTQEIPEPLLSQLHEARLFRMLLPRSVGGDQVEPWTYLRAIEEIAR